MIVLGRIVAPFGVHGWLRIHPFGDDPESWRSIPQWWFSLDSEAVDGLWVARGVEIVKRHGDGFVVKLAGVDDRNAAEAMDCYYFGALRADLPVSKSGEYYWSDLLGLAVVTLHGEPLGRVKSLVETGAHQVLVVEGDRERLLPFVANVVSGVDLVTGVIRVDWGFDW